MSQATVPLAGVIGDPVAHSRSPRLHAHWLNRYGLTGHYVPLHIAGRDLSDVLRALPRMGFVGANVTVPHKELVLQLSDGATPMAKRIGAANTLIFRPDGRIHADNTDVYGFTRCLQVGAEGWVPAAGPAMVFGAGGAARAVLVALQEMGVPEIRLVNRSRDRADALAQKIGGKISVLNWKDAEGSLAECAAAVNTTSLGMQGQPDFPDILGMMREGALAADIVYTPVDTPFLRAAARVGAKTVDGVGMLLHQAVPGFERWFGIRPEVDEEARRVVLQ